MPSEEIEPVSFRGVSRAIYNSSDRFARTADSAVGELLSLALLPVLGIRVVLLCNQLRNSWVWRCDPPVEVADVRATREHHWRVVAWNIGKPLVFDRHAARRSRKAATIVRTCSSRRPELCSIDDRKHNCRRT